MDGYGKPGYTREEFQREMDDELNAVSSLDREYQQTLEEPGDVLDVEAGLSEILNTRKCIDAYGNEREEGHIHVDGHAGCARCGGPTTRTGTADNPVTPGARSPS